jgi:hypothetical protein
MTSKPLKWGNGTAMDSTYIIFIKLFVFFYLLKILVDLINALKKRDSDRWMKLVDIFKTLQRQLMAFMRYNI